MNGAQWIVQALQKKNVDIIFGYPGGAIMPLYDALFNSGLEHLLCRHEQGAIFSAIGYAKATGKIGICFATSGPGATNLVTGLADALLDSVPIIAITGQVSLDLMGTDAFQEIDVLGLSLACTKHSFLVQSLTMLPDIINEAFFLVSNGRPGPILIDIPKDIQLETGNFFTKSYIFSKKGNTCSVSYEDINRARLLMSQSCRPILYVGGGVGIADAVVSLRRFILKTGIPTVVTLKGLGSADCSQDCYLGMLGMHGNQAANLAVQQCDLLIAVGARFDDRVTGKLSSFAPYAKVIHLDIDSAEFGKLRSVDVSLLGDLNNLLLRLEQCLFIDSWKESIRLLKKKYRWIYSNTDEVIYAPSLLRVISDCAPKNTIVTTDVGQHQMWTAQHMKFNYPENFITSGGLGTMGFGIPAAIGAEIGRPGYTVVCISGDGSFMMNIQELATIKRKGLSTKIVLLDNQSLGMVRQWQELFFEKRYSETKLKDNPNFLILARAFDISGICIKDKTQIKDGVKLLFEHNGPFLLHVIISDNENVWPLVPPGSSNSSMLEKL